MSWGGKHKAKMGTYTPTDKELKAYWWCIKNNIRISAYAKNQFKWYIDIVIGKYKKDEKINRTPVTYKKDIVWEQIYKYCEYYYNKREK